MRSKVLVIGFVITCFMVPAALAQQGHPLAGIWLGDWGPTPTERNQVLLELNWTTTTLSGTINPGFPDAATIRVGTLNSGNWTVHLEADGEDEDGNPVLIVIDGELENLGSPKRTLTGTWNRGGTESNFTLTRE